MKVTYISSSIIPSRTANSIHVMKVCQAFSELGHEVTLLAPDVKDNYEKDITDVYEFYGTSNIFNIAKLPWLTYLKGTSLFYGFFAALKSHRMNADLVFCRDFHGAFFASLMGKKVVYESHTPICDSNAKGLKPSMFRNMISKKNFKNLVVITHSLKAYYLANFPQLKGKIIVAADGADPIAPDTEPFDFKNDKNRMQVGYVGHLYPGRGVDIIIELASMCDWADFHIIGGQESDINHWKALSNDLSNVTFHGFVSPSEAERMRMGCEVLLAPYQSSVAVSGGGGNTVKWMSPLKVFEYMAAGKAILSSDIPVLHEVLQDKKNSLLCIADQPVDWAEKLITLRDDPVLKNTLGESALKDFVSSYSWYSRVNNIMNEIH